MPPAATVHPTAQRGEDLFEISLRPRTFEGFVGQERVVENLRLALAAAKARKEPLDHLLLSGLPGLGKTTLAAIVARDMGTELHVTSGPALMRPADLVGILTNLEEGDFLFIDEIHRVPRAVEEKLYGAMEDFAVDVVLDQGPGARSLRLSIKRFTLVGATTREGLLGSPFRARFGLQEKLDLYPATDLATILVRSAESLQVRLSEEAAGFIATRSRGTPRVANRFLRRVRDLAQEHYGNAIDLAVAAEGLKRLGVDEHGLCLLDRRILSTLLRHGGGPVGLKTIAVAVGEEERTIEDVYEPYLIRQGLLRRTPQGRCASGTCREMLDAKETGLLF
ncbi:MAG TPA: Holliday junction branch migration DNA helicase RuvB [Planctomycetota bacterium]|nr:Holliday junction branch migration DNA helicase RuvB [Planctomycetota bacterium]